VTPAERRTAAPDVVRLAEVRTEPLSLDECRRAVSGPADGAVVLFVGQVRNNDQAGGRPVVALEYSAHPRATAELARIAREVAEAATERLRADDPDAVRGVRGVAVLHRVGRLAVGEDAVVVAAAAPHREEAFAVCRELLDEVTRAAPVWKYQVFADGAAEWVGVPATG
jgi:molybdopterin synthase catalytic subunit